MKRTTSYSPSGRPSGDTDWNRLRSLTSAEREEHAATDPDNPPLTGDDDDTPDARERGKVGIFIRLNTEVVDFFKAQGPGYQTRINSVLCSYVRGELQPRPKPRHPPVTRLTTTHTMKVTGAGPSWGGNALIPNAKAG